MSFPLKYDPLTGGFTWLETTGKRSVVGKVAGGLDDKGYVRIRVMGKKHRAHRLAVLCMTGKWPTSQVDHINGDRSDNRWANLRQATQSQNSMNIGRRSTNASGFKGVHWNKATQKWRACITINQKKFHLGLFQTAELAFGAYRLAAEKHHGPFLNTGHIPMPNETPKLTAEEALAIIAAKTAPKVTKESIEAKIEGVSYLQHDHLTICVITMKNGFMALGKSAPASAANFDKEVGQRLAYDAAFRELWPVEGYLLLEILSTRKPDEATTTA